MANRRVEKLLDLFAAAEQEFLNQEFLAPAVKGGLVHVRINGVVLKLRVEPADFEGWGIFLPITHESAMLVREATLAERRRYLQITPKISLILCDRRNGQWAAVASGNQQKIKLNATVPVRLVDGADLFDTIDVGFDGSNFWFDRIDPRADSVTAAWLRSSLAELRDPAKLQRKGLTAQQRVAYVVNHAMTVVAREQVRRDSIEQQLREALHHAGAKLDSYVEHKDGYRVTYRSGGRRHVSSVGKRDLTVQVAGICLSGQDRKFDLSSLVGVLNEQHARYALQVGDGGISEREYWDIHPPNG